MSNPENNPEAARQTAPTPDSAGKAGPASMTGPGGQQPTDADTPFGATGDERGSGFGDGIEPDREPGLDKPEQQAPANGGAPPQTTTGAVNRDARAAQQREAARATTLSTADPVASLDSDDVDQDAISGDAVRTRPYTTPMRPAPTPAVDPDAVLQPETSRQFRERWHAIQAEFVDDPRHAVEDADRLLTDVTSAFNSGLEDRRRALSKTGQRDGDGETEQLRLTLHRYRALVDAMLHD